MAQYDGSQVRIRTFFDLFSRSMVNALCKSEKQKKVEKIKKILWASAADPGIKICPYLAGSGLWFDYAVRPEPGWR